MALNATIHRCTLQVSDLDRGYYQTHALTLARHPSETDQRMMMRVLAFALNADEHLSFTRGLSQDDEPDLW
ncbi:MAG: YaeQ family protein, partial [Sedimenticolaceae bacterium]